ncbi:hypothetical protein AMS68_004321 [Peltaster fructicola]|uniref:EF-hand domain-containing protein n=1 Tax=Peltaster fructicola TaxID=286661 RepID=A0A6H0XVQ1_9PEZI|nr:hypothetical protein AMS68_004321 [Peltaster fructicola]
MANTGTHAAFNTRQYTTNVPRQQNQYNTGAYHPGAQFQAPQQPQQAYNTSTQPQHARHAPERLDTTALEGLTDEQREEINEAFALFDLDKDHRIDYHEMKVALKALGFELSKPDLANIMQTYGTSANGKPTPVPTFTGPSRLVLSQAAFQAEAARRIADRDPVEEINRAFELFDQDGKGRIEYDDLKRVAQELGEGLQEEELRAMIEEFDIRGEGGISREEFLGICLG